MESLRAVDELTIYPIVDNETDFLSSPCDCCAAPDSGIKYTPERLRMKPIRRSQQLNRIADAAHGLSLLLVAETNGVQRTMLFDAGPNPTVFQDNANKLHADLSAVEHVVLSHWHTDHSGGLRAAVPLIAETRAVKGLSKPIVDLHPDWPVLRGQLLPDGTVIPQVPTNPSPDELESFGGTVVSSKEPRAVLDGMFYVSGEIPRVEPYETGLPSHHSMINGKWVHDPLIMDERYVAVHVKDRGLVIFSACSHAGIINVCKDAMHKAARAKLKEPRVFGIMGGLHLASDGEDRIEPTVKALAEGIRPTIIFPGHCTGWRAKNKLLNALPGHVQPCSVGGAYKFTSIVNGLCESISDS